MVVMGDAPTRSDIAVEGMTCAACAARIEKVLNRAPGVRAAVNLATETAHVEYEPDRATPQSLIEAVRKAGYDAKAAPIYAHALVGMVAFVGQWWRETRNPPPAETVASHAAALAWMGLRHLPKRPGLMAGKRERARK